MILRRLLTALTYALPILVVTFSVLMGGFGLASGTNDAFGAAVLWRIAMAAGLLIAIDVILLVGVLGIHALSFKDDNRQDTSRDE